MNTMPKILMSTTVSDDCRLVLDYLMFDWPEEPGDDKSPAFLRHLCHCSECLRKWISLEAAADLASLSLCNEGLSSRGSDCLDEDSPLSKSSECPAHRPTAGLRP